ncbi:MAG: glycosyltransferase [Planctomycetota bacterium]
MLDALSTDVSFLVTDCDRAASEYATVVIRRASPTLGRRASARLGLMPSAWPVDELERVLQDDRVSSTLVHFATVAVSYRKAFERVGKPVFIHCHGYDVTWDMRASDGSGRRIHSKKYVEAVRSMPSCVRFIANSQECKQRLLAIGLDESRVFVKPLGVEVAEECPVRERGSAETLLFLGRLVDCKGPDLTIQAFNRACDQGFSGRLVMAGDGPLRQACETLATESPHCDRIELLGPVDEEEGDRLRREATIFTAHSCRGRITRQKEAFGVGFLEALAAGLPVVTGRSGGVSEIVEHGKTGILFEPGDVDAHARALLDLQASSEASESMGRAGWVRAKEQFSLDIEMQMLRQILGLRPRRPNTPTPQPPNRNPPNR